MRMPGFSAEDSLYQPSGHYRRAAGGGAQAGQVLPQQLVIDMIRGSERVSDYLPLPVFPHRPSLWCLLKYDGCASGCVGLEGPDNVLCRSACSLRYRRCVAGQA